MWGQGADDTWGLFSWLRNHQMISWHLQQLHPCAWWVSIQIRFGMRKENLIFEDEFYVIIIHLYIYSTYHLPNGALRIIRQKAMAPHSRTLARKIPWTEEPGRLQSMRSLRVGHNWATSLSLSTVMRWRRKWQPTSVFLPGESQGRGSLVGCCLWGHTESDTTEVT